MIVCAAIKSARTGKIYRGHRHNHCFKALNDEMDQVRDAIQGFLTDKGEFVDRTQGAKIALESGQISKLAHPPYLYSEDLY